MRFRRVGGDPARDYHPLCLLGEAGADACRECLESNVPFPVETVRTGTVPDLTATGCAKSKRPTNPGYGSRGSTASPMSGGRSATATGTDPVARRAGWGVNYAASSSIDGRNGTAPSSPSSISTVISASNSDSRNAAASR